MYPVVIYVFIQCLSERKLLLCHWLFFCVCYNVTINFLNFFLSSTLNGYTKNYLSGSVIRIMVSSLLKEGKIKPPREFTVYSISVTLLRIVCICKERERERKRKREKERERERWNDGQVFRCDCSAFKRPAVVPRTISMFVGCFIHICNCVIVILIV